MFCNGCGKELAIPQEPCPNCGALNTSSGQHRSADTLTGIVSHVGLVIDEKYQIVSKLGSGGMATVYRATRRLIGDTVAIKILHPDQVRDPQSAERFRREAQAAARLKHPNAVTIHDFGVSADGLIYLVMELVEGKSVRAMIREQGPLTPTTAAEILRQACAALEEAHKQNIVHRDVKPDNILVAVTPTGLRVKVLDFGIARMRDIAAANITQTGSVMGTPHYMSPEQCLGEELDSRSDIYSLGVVLFEMLAGIVPFNSPTSSAVIIQHVNQAPPPLRVINISVPPAVETVVLHALSKRREDRPQSAQLLAEELNDAVAGGSVARENADIARSKTDGASMGARDGLAPTMQMSMPAWSGAKQTPQVSGHQVSGSQRPWVWVAGAAVPILAVAAWFLYSSSKAADSSESAQPESASAIRGTYEKNSQQATLEITSDKMLLKAGSESLALDYKVRSITGADVTVDVTVPKEIDPSLPSSVTIDMVVNIRDDGALVITSLVPHAGGMIPGIWTRKQNPNVASSIRRVDFRNFTYPLDDHLARNYSTDSVRVRKGRFIFSRHSDYGPDGFEVTRIIYGDLTGDGQEEATVITAIGFIESGTTQQAPVTHAYIYTMRNGRPVLLKIYDSESDDSDANIAYRNYYRDNTTLLYGGVTRIESGLLVVESLGGAARCCPEYKVTMRFRWDGQRFILAGQPQRRTMN